MKKIQIIIILLGVFGCTRNEKKLEAIHLTERPDNLHLKKEFLINKIQEIGFVNLPYRVNYGCSTQNTSRVDWKSDSLIIKDFSKSDNYLIGFLPDTSKYYAALYVSVAGDAIPCVVTFSKNGQKISSEKLTENNCDILAGDIISCEEYTEINKNLNLNYYHKSEVIYELANLKLDTACTHYEKEGKIEDSGLIKFGKRQTYNCQ